MKLISFMVVINAFLAGAIAAAAPSGHAAKAPAAPASSAAKATASPVPSAPVPTPTRAPVSPGSPGSALRAEIVRDSAALTAENGSEAATLKLKSYPRTQLVSEVIALLKDEEKGGRPAALRVIRALELTELVPEMRKHAVTASDWQLYSTLNHFLPSQKTADRQALEVLYLNRVSQNLAGTSINALLDGLAELKTVLPQTLYQKLLSHPEYEIRQGALEQFLASREKLPVDDQIKRFSMAFALKPYQVRLAAYEAFESLPTPEQKKLSAALPKEACRVDRKEIQVVCLPLVSGPDANAKAGK